MFTKSWYLLNGALLNRGLGVIIKMAFDCYKHHNLLRESKMHLLYIYSLLAMMVSNLKNGLSALFSARGLLPANVTQIFLMIPMIRMPLFPLLQLRDLPYKYLIIYLGFFFFAFLGH